ncbi:hypothetical protein E2C01_000378 [Portunus trituberculatus]|uniref:Uncharacterized protein n=1 Tax=Portunus trituberculatus TaxID=210409 RepID=A0A5B7CGB3_PORTR|nr:hypothetical protein [Portunus trituberculatus]
MKTKLAPPACQSLSKTTLKVRSPVPSGADTEPRLRPRTATYHFASSGPLSHSDLIWLRETWGTERGAAEEEEEPARRHSPLNSGLELWYATEERLD